MSDPATLAWYEANAHRFGGGTRRAHSRFLDRFLDRLAPRASVLELGCGAGRDAARMAARGFLVDPTDGTDAMVALARDGYGLPARRMRFDELSAVGMYDALWAHACLIHVPRADLPGVIAAIYRALRPGGWHFADFKLGDGEGRDPLGRLTNFPDRDWLSHAYCEAGFEIAEAEMYRGEGADGVVRDWCAMCVRRR